MRLWHYRTIEFEPGYRKRYFGGKDKAEQGIQQAGKDITAESAMTGQETSQYEKSFGLGDILDALYQYKLGLGGAPSGYLSPEEQLKRGGPMVSKLYDTTLSDLMDPYASYESTLQPQLKATEDYINRRAHERGLLTSGIPIEDMGRAGVELAIAEADKRMSYRSQALQSAAAMAQYAQQGESSSIGNLANFYSQQQQFGLQAKGRATTGATSAAQYQAYPYQAQLGDYYGAKSAMYALPGQVISAAGAAYNPAKKVAG